MADLLRDRPGYREGRLLSRAAPYGLAAIALLIAAAVYANHLRSRELPRQPPGAWYPAAPSPIARALAPGIVIGKKLYLFGGFYTRGLKVTRRVDVYDPAADRWTRLADMPIANTHIATAVDGDTAWLAGGFAGDHPGKATTRVYKYHAPTDSWSEGPPLPAPRAAGAMVRIGRTLHFFGGYTTDRDTTPGDHWALPLDGDQRWTRRAPLSEPRGHLAAVVLDGAIYAMGGAFNHDNNRQDVAFVQRYDPATDRWTARAPMPYGASHIDNSALVWNGRIYVFGGRSDERRSLIDRILRRHPVARRTALPDVIAYDPATDRWAPQQELPVGLMIPVVVAIGDRIIVTNGSTLYTYFPQSSTYTGCFPLKSRPASLQRPC